VTNQTGWTCHTPKQKKRAEENRPRANTSWQTPAQAEMGQNGKGKSLAVPV
jgi:hypothetical protein